MAVPCALFSYPVILSALRQFALEITVTVHLFFSFIGIKLTLDGKKGKWHTTRHKCIIECTVTVIQFITARGDINQINGNQLLLQGGIGGAVGVAIPIEVKINRFTSGRNNASAIYTGLRTRFTSGDIVQMQLRYAIKDGVANAIKGLYGQGAGAFVDGAVKKTVGQ